MYTKFYITSGQRRSRRKLHYFKDCSLVESVLRTNDWATPTVLEVERLTEQVIRTEICVACWNRKKRIDREATNFVSLFPSPQD